MDVVRNHWHRSHLTRTSSHARVLDRILPSVRVYQCRPLRAFAEKVDEYLHMHPELDTVIILNWRSTYFLEFFKDDVEREIISIHHPERIARLSTLLSGGHYFGTLLRARDYGYFRFYPPDSGQYPEALFVGGLGPKGRPPFSGKVDLKDYPPEIEVDGFKAYRVGYERKTKEDLRLPFTFKRQSRGLPEKN